MAKGEVIEKVKNEQTTPSKPVQYTDADIAKISELFSIFIKIDQKGKYAKAKK
ncbi:MAG: hypothetical protein ACD_57C00224G0004 [uncultured bacterium]|nr:MAG: hypothetical protein ACD_57C00224G0004 [uncultured bacterium]